MFSAEVAPLASGAAALLGEKIVEIVACTPGGNNRVYRVHTPRDVFALKAYRRSAEDPRDRLGAEVAGLEYASIVAPGSTPRVVASDADGGFAIYEWVDG